MMRIARPAVAVFFVLHGFAHVLGFLGSWRLAEFKDVPYTTFVLNGSVDVGDLGIRLVGILWLLAAAAFAGAAIALLRGAYPLVALLATLSLGVCLVGLPAAIVGVWIDVAILVALAIRLVARPGVLRVAVR